VDVGVQLTGEPEQMRLAEIMIKELNSLTSNNIINHTTTHQKSNPSVGDSLADWSSKESDSSGMKKPKWESDRPMDSDRWQQSSSFEPHRRQHNFDSENRQSQPPENALIVKVPSGIVGRIIGRGGSKINELQEQSGARIKV
jgi:hypothetical protein